MSDMQTSVAVADGAITGTLKYLSSGQLVTDWGAGNFMALKFTESNANVEKIYVGLTPSVSSGLVPLDADMDGVFKVTDKDTQVLTMVEVVGGFAYPSTLDLSGLTCQTA